MTRVAVIFEDAGWTRLYPLTLSRATFDCRVGVTTLARRLATQVARHQVKRADLLCRPLLRPLTERDYLGHAVNREPDGDVLFLNGRLLCLGEGMDTLVGLLDRAVAVQVHGELAAVKFEAPAARSFWHGLTEALSRGEPPPLPADHTVVAAPDGIRLLRYPWDLVAMNAEVLEDDYRWIHAAQESCAPDLAPGAQTLHRERIVCREGVRIEAGAILDAASGPIIVGEGVRVLHNAVVLGPAYVGPRSEIQIGAKILGGVSLGPMCKVGGEVEAAIFQGYANKRHDGFLGHAYVGAWTNLGAATNNSDLKNNYSTIRVWTPQGPLDTGQRFVGLFLGDHSKTAVGTTFHTGTVVGFSCNLFGAGPPPKHVPSFSWGGAAGLDLYDLDKAREVARTVMQRRQVGMEPADDLVFRTIFEERGRFL